MRSSRMRLSWISHLKCIWHSFYSNFGSFFPIPSFLSTSWLSIPPLSPQNFFPVPPQPPYSLFPTSLSSLPLLLCNLSLPDPVLFQPCCPPPPLLKKSHMPFPPSTS